MDRSGCGMFVHELNERRPEGEVVARRRLLELEHVLHVLHELHEVLLPHRIVRVRQDVPRGRQ